MTDTIISQDNALITVAVGGTSLGAFDTRSGGSTSATVNKSRSGDQPDVEETWPSRRTTDTITVTRKKKSSRDLALAKQLRAQVGRARGSVTEQPRDENDVVHGEPTTWTGRLTSVDTGDSDVNGSDATMLTLTFTVESTS